MDNDDKKNAENMKLKKIQIFFLQEIYQTRKKTLKLKLITNAYYKPKKKHTCVEKCFFFL